MEFPPGLTLRNATLKDTQAVIDLINASEIVDVGEAVLELSDIQTDWESPMMTLDDDVLLVEDDGRLVAWAQVEGERADANVHPDHRRQGIGLALIRWTEQRALDRAADDYEVRIGQTVPEKMVGIPELFEARGYSRLWDSWVLRLPPNVELATRVLPDGISIRPFRGGEELTVHRVIDDAFSEWEESEPQPFERWQARTLSRPDFDPSLLLIAVDNGEPIGACVGVPYESEGWVSQLAVGRSHRRRGIASALLAALFTEFRSRGVQQLGLNTDSRTGALGLYLNLGMAVELTYTRWSKVLRPVARNSRTPRQ